MHESLTDMLFNIVADHDSEQYKKLYEALERYEEILNIVHNDSLARDGMEMIEAAMRGLSDG